jgi:outer membrane lipoprotein-sorting protein
MVRRVHRWSFGGALAVLVAVAPLHAQTSPPLTPVQIAANMQATYGATTAFDADFEQRYRAKAFGKTIDSKGHVTFEQPDRFLFTYSTPPGDVTVSDGKWIRIYTASSKTSCEGAVTASMIPAAFAFLSGKKSLAVDFNLSLLPPATCAYPAGHCLIAKPKVPTTAYDFLSFKVDGASFTVRRVTIVDAQKNSNRFDFVKPTPPALVKIKPGLFQWKPPAGTTIKPLGAC